MLHTVSREHVTAASSCCAAGAMRASSRRTASPRRVASPSTLKPNLPKTLSSSLSSFGANSWPSTGGERLTRDIFASVVGSPSCRGSGHSSRQALRVLVQWWQMVLVRASCEVCGYLGVVIRQSWVLDACSGHFLCGAVGAGMACLGLTVTCPRHCCGRRMTEMRYSTVMKQPGTYGSHAECAAQVQQEVLHTCWSDR